ncbi:sigma-E processing peptidase SpoIIGA [Bacillus coreaensis]
MTLYLDVIWLLNLLFDTLLLYLTAIIVKREYKIWRLFCGGLIGSFIIILAFTPFQNYSGHPIVKLAFSLVMVLVTFGYKRVRTFIRTTMTFYFVTFLVGGALIGVHYFIQFDNQLTSSVLIGSVKGFGDPISWFFVLLGFPIAWHFSRSNIEQFEMTKIQFDQMVSIHIQIGESQLTCKGLIDSGNQLYDPLTKMPVMFVSVHNQLDTIPESIRILSSEKDEIIYGSASLPTEWENKLRIIPYKVVGQEHQLIIAIKPDQLQIEMEEKIIQVDKGLVSFTTQQLSSDDTFQCIVHPKMVTGVAKVKSDVKVS